MKADVKVEITESCRKKQKACRNLSKATRYQMTGWGTEFVRYLKEVATRGRYIGKYKGGTRTGQLRRTIGMKLLPQGSDAYKLEVGTTGSKYARILEKGGVIRPVRKKMLTIPLPGVKGWARNYDNTFIQRSRKGNLLIFQKVGKGIKPLFVLKDRVRIPAFMWMEKSLRDRRGKLDNMLSKTMLYRVAERMN